MLSEVFFLCLLKIATLYPHVDFELKRLKTPKLTLASYRNKRDKFNCGNWMKITYKLEEAR